MEKEYNYTPEDTDNNEVREPGVEYNYQTDTDIKLSPPLTEEELKNALTADELLERLIPRIKNLFIHKKSTTSDMLPISM